MKLILRSKQQMIVISVVVNRSYLAKVAFSASLPTGWDRQTCDVQRVARAFELD